MTNRDIEQRSEETTSSEPEVQPRSVRVAHGAGDVVGAARAGATRAIRRVPGTVRAARSGAHEATSALQRLPDSTLRWLAAGSVGLAAGFQLAGAPRLVRAAGAAPALLMGAAIALRPTEPPAAADHPPTPAAGVDAMDEPAEGAIGTAAGTQGVAEDARGDIHDAVAGPTHAEREGA